MLASRIPETSERNTYSINLAYSGIVRDDKIDELGNELLGCRLAHKEPDVLEGVGGPRKQDQETNQNGTDRIDKPRNAASNNRHGKAECIDDNIISVIHEKDVYGRVAAEQETVDA